MKPKAYQSKAVSDKQALHELQKTHPKLHKTKAFENAIKDLNTKIPPRFRSEATTLVSIWYHNSKYHTFNINFEPDFYHDNHWIVIKYEQIRKKQDTRDFLQSKFMIHQFDFVKKNPEQMEEVKEISDMARTLFIILIQCSFIPTNYLCLLAILMKEHDNIIHWDNNTVLSNEFYIDILLNHGAITLEIAQTEQRCSNDSDGMGAMEQNFSLMTHEADIIDNDLTPEGSQVLFPNSNWSKQSSPVIRNKEKLTSMTFQGLIRGEHQLEHEEIILQEALLQDINTKNQLDKAQINLNTDNEHEWALKDVIPGFSSDESNYTKSEYKLDNVFRYKSLGKSNPPSIHLKKLGQEQNDNLTLYVSNLKRGVTIRQLENVFEDFGPLKQVHKNNIDAKYALITFHYQQDALTALKTLNGTHFHGRHMKIKIAHNKGTFVLHQPEAEGKKPETEIKDQTSDDDQSQESFEIIPQEHVTKSEEEIEIHEPNSMMESEEEINIDEEEIDIDEDEKPLTIIDETLEYFDHNLCVVHPGDESFEEKENDPPTSPASSSSSTPFHGFDDVVYADHYEKDDTVDERLKEFNDNSLQIYAVADVAIPPYKESSVIVKLNESPSSREITSIPQVEGKIILTAGLSPYPQLQDGVYHVTNSRLEIQIRNNSDQTMVIEKNEIIRGVDCHSWRFVKRILMEREGNSTEIDHFDFSQWHLEAKKFKIMNDWSQKFETLRTINPWVIDNVE
jgi:RNA recognition motif-containing protein